MRKIYINPPLRETIGQVHLSVMQGKAMVQESPKELLDLMNQQAEKIQQSMQIEDIAKLPQIHYTREAYKALGKKPARYRVSSEALTRRIIQGKGLYFINNLVDINNLVSIQSGCGICLYDLEKVHGDITLRIAEAGETYKGIGKYDLNLESLPVFCDAIGPFGSPTSDSERTMITNQTKEFLFIIVSFSPDGIDNKYIRYAEKLMRQFAEAEEIVIEKYGY